MKVKVAIISISSLLLIGLYFFAANAFKGSEEVRLGSLAEVNQKLFIPDHAPRLGDKNAPVKLVEFLDPECGTCRVFYPYVKQILLKFEGKVELVVRYAPFHRNSINEYISKRYENRFSGRFNDFFMIDINKSNSI